LARATPVLPSRWSRVPDDAAVVENFLEFRGGCFAIFGSQERVPAHKGRVEAGNVGDEDDSPNSMGDNGTLAAQEVDSQHLTSSGRLGGVAFTLAKPKSRISACPRSVRQRRAEVLGRRSDRGVSWANDAEGIGN